MDSMRCNGKVAFDSGAGIGNAAAKRIAAEGGAVVYGLLDEGKRPAMGNLEGSLGPGVCDR